MSLVYYLKSYLIFLFFLKLKPINAYMTQSLKIISETLANSDFIIYLCKWVSGLTDSPSNFLILLYKCFHVRIKNPHCILQPVKKQGDTGLKLT